MRKVLTGLEEAAALVKNGDVLTTGGATFHRAPMEFLREIIRQGKKDLVISEILGSQQQVVDPLVHCRGEQRSVRGVPGPVRPREGRLVTRTETADLMVYAMSREIENLDTVLHGVSSPLPVLAMALLERLTPRTSRSFPGLKEWIPTGFAHPKLPESRSGRGATSPTALAPLVEESHVA